MIHRNIERDGAGAVVMMPEETEDMWHVFNLIAEGDSVRASTVRKVTNESAIGVRTAEKVRGEDEKGREREGKGEMGKGSTTTLANLRPVQKQKVNS